MAIEPYSFSKKREKNKIALKLDCAIIKYLTLQYNAKPIIKQTVSGRH